MLERKEAQAAQRGSKVVEKIAGLMEARAKGEDIRLEELLALVDGCRDEHSAEEIARWKRKVGEDWDRIEAPSIQPAQAPSPKKPQFGLLPWRPKPKPTEKAETDKDPPKTVYQ